MLHNLLKVVLVTIGRKSPLLIYFLIKIRKRKNKSFEIVNISIHRHSWRDYHNISND